MSEISYTPVQRPLSLWLVDAAYLVALFGLVRWLLAF